MLNLKRLSAHVINLRNKHILSYFNRAFVHCMKLTNIKNCNEMLHRNLYVGSALDKYKKIASKNQGDIDVDTEPEFLDERDSRVVKTSVNSLRADLLLRAGLGMARNKIEVIFYESKIRVNGKKLPKKSVQLNVGDEIDVIKDFSQNNPTHLVISRVVILSVDGRENGFSVNLRKYKSLLIENYSGSNAFKSSEVSIH